MPRHLRVAVETALLCGFFFGAGQVFAQGERTAEVVSVQGVGESRPDERAPWRVAMPQASLYSGNYVRTGAYSRMGLLFADRTQIRLNEQTLLQIKSPTLLRLEQGRSWSQTNRVPANLYLETPSATMAIRGTDWEIEVREDGRALLTVFSGEVEFFNDFGRITVAKNEHAQALPGRAPVKLLLANPRDRIQWVSAYSADPRRHLGAPPGSPERARLERIAADIAAERFEQAMRALQDEMAGPARQPDAWLMASDLMVSQGRLERASDHAQAGLARFPNDPRLLTQLARVGLAAGDFDLARGRVQAALQAAPASAEANVVAGDVARARGEAAPARSAYQSAIARDPREDRAWYGLGTVDAEREDVAPARRSLNRALEINPEGPGYQGELGTLETFANNFSAAEPAFRAALERNPNDYVALTGMGVMEIKRGAPDKALEAFLRASLLEPRYARARMYAAVAHYQLGRRELALSELARAAELDDKDPMPHLLASMIHTDYFRPADAIASARKALELLPNLKSLNQIANDQQGSANLGNALAFFGLDDWAQSYAQESYYPFWAGSHFFLSDRYPGQFNKNSELMQGFITDPTAFGGSEKFQPLIASPGFNARGVLNYNYSNAQAVFTPRVRLNGNVNSGVPLAYLGEFTASHFRQMPDSPGETDQWTGIAAVGFKPSADLGIFFYGFRDQVDGRFVTAFTPGDNIEINETNRIGLASAGANYKFSPTSQLWTRVSNFTQSPSQSGFVTGVAGGPFYSRVTSRQPEFGARHTFRAARHEITWGLDYTRHDATTDWSFGLPVHTEDSEDSTDFYVSDRFDLNSRLLLQADVWFQQMDRRRTSEAPAVFIPETRTLDKTNLRLATRVRLTNATLVRLGYQNWIKPLGLGSLGPVATAGIPVDDRLVARGGTQERWRAQLESEASPRAFWSAFADYKKIDNQLYALRPFRVEEDNNLVRLRGFNLSGLSSGDLYEFLSPPEFEAGRVTSFGGGASGILSDTWSVNSRYQYTDSRNTGPVATDAHIPMLPRHAAQLGATWISPQRIYFISRAIYRTERYTNEVNTSARQAGWDVNLDAFLESSDKRRRVLFSVLNVLHPEIHTQYVVTLSLSL